MKDYEMNGPGYTIRVPGQFELKYHDPQTGRVMFQLQPEFAQSLEGLATEFIGLLAGAPIPGAEDTGAFVSLHPLQPSQIVEAIREQTLWDNPQFAGTAGAGMGIPRITVVGSVRQERRLADTLYFRELEGYNLVGTRLHLMHLVVRGHNAGVECFIFMGLAVWPKYLAPCLQLIGGINVSGGASGQATLEAVLDRSRPDQVEYRLRNQDGSNTPLTAMPTVIENHYVINIDQSIKTGDINGTGVVVGHHSISRVD
jgi:hypothetical protein